MQDPDSDWCDVRFGCVAQDHGLELTYLDGTYGWPLENASLEESIVERKTNVSPLVFHYIDKEHMQRIHKERAGATSKRTRTAT